MRRRDFIKSSAFSGSALLLQGGGAKAGEATSPLNDPPPIVPSVQKGLA